MMENISGRLTRKKLWRTGEPRKMTKISARTLVEKRWEWVQSIFLPILNSK
jgi:hypothetical protein